MSEWHDWMHDGDYEDGRDPAGEAMSEAKRTELGELLEILFAHFSAEPHKVFEWMLAPNPMMGGMRPNDMIVLGRTAKLLKIVKALVEGDVP